MITISSDEMDRAFRESLAELAAGASGCQALDCGTWGPAAPLARLCFASSDGNDAYFVHAGLRADAGLRAERWATRVSAVRAPEEGERRYALDVTMSGPGARDGRLLAVLVLTAVLSDIADHEEAGSDGS
jgi:hypothetical protein